MSNSPFHGIFSAFEQGLQDGNLSEESMSSFVEPAPVERGTRQQMPMNQQTTGSQQGQTGRVAVDIYEMDDYYIIKAPIAGVRLSDLDIEVNENVVTIRGNRRQTDDIPQNQYYLQECFWGPFSRSVTLPFTIDARKIRATFNKDCVLKILIPKEDKVKIVKISEG